MFCPEAVPKLFISVSEPYTVDSGVCHKETCFKFLTPPIMLTLAAELAELASVTPVSPPFTPLNIVTGKKEYSLTPARNYSNATYPC